MPRPGETGELVGWWIEWLRGRCEIRGHGPHLRHQCFSSLEEALRGCVTLDAPKD